MKREKLVFIHSFPANSVILKGLKDYLQDYFNVFFIDLPGFNKKVPPLKKFTLDNYSRYVEDQIKELKLKNYILGGAAFGFLVANNCKKSKDCKGFLGFQPFINTTYMRKNLTNLTISKMFLSFVTLLHISKLVYHSWFFKIFLSMKYPGERIKKMRDTIDAKTFFKTTQMIQKTKTIPKFQEKPYIVVINKGDTTIKAKKLIGLFQSETKGLIINMTSKNYPKNPTKQYFKKNIIAGDIKKITNFCKSM